MIEDAQTEASVLAEEWEAMTTEQRLDLIVAHPEWFDTTKESRL